MIARVLIGLAGLGVSGYGGLLLLDLDPVELLEVAVWLGAGVLVHDAVLAPLVVAVGLLLARVTPVWARPAVTMFGVVLGAVTLAVAPVLGQFAATAAKPTLLDRDYATGWVIFAGAVSVVALAVAAWFRLLRPRLSGSSRAAREDL